MVTELMSATAKFAQAVFLKQQTVKKEEGPWCKLCGLLLLQQLLTVKAYTLNTITNSLQVTGKET